MGKLTNSTVQHYSEYCNTHGHNFGSDWMWRLKWQKSSTANL